MMSQTKARTASKLLMGVPAPPLEIHTLNDGHWKLRDQRPQSYTMIVFYRGLHCPICASYIATLAQKLDAFSKLGITVIAISSDDKTHATHFYQQNHLRSLTVGYGLTHDDTRRWGLYMSKGYFAQEPECFSEPALFLIKPDGHLYLANIGTHPFSRVNFDFLLEGLDYVITHDYPFRGTEL